MIEEIQEYIFTYHPFDKEFPIRSISIQIIARNRKEAELISMRNSYKFFDQSCTVVVKEGGKGYREIKSILDT
jgi:hypothetical protein